MHEARRIRSAGRTSGSVEITLPAEMQALEGVECRLILRDGARPEIVLQPDVSQAQAVFAELWERLRLALQKIGDIGAFSLADFDVALFPARYWRDKPPLSYRDALAIQRSRQEKASPGRFREAPEVTHVLTFLAVDAGYRLGVEGPLASAFGVVVGYLVSGLSAGHGADFERETALTMFEGKVPLASMGSLFDAGPWQGAQEGFARVFAKFQQWQENPAEYEAARQKWWQALTVEAGVRVSTVEDFLREASSRRRGRKG